MDDEVSELEDIARQSAVLVRWFSRDDVPFTELTDEEKGTIDRDAHALHKMLQRNGYYDKDWGS